MGWVLSPPFFCTASETARDVAAFYVFEAQGALLEHHLEKLAMPDEDSTLPYMSTVLIKDGTKFLHMLEVYIDDSISLAQIKDHDKLQHLSRALLHGIHSVFPHPEISGHNREESTSVKKLKEGEGLWEARKDISGWVMDSATRCIVGSPHTGCQK